MSQVGLPPTERKPRRRLTDRYRQLAQIGLAQIASSSSNILAIVLTSHYSHGSIDEFRIGSLVFALHAFLIGIIRVVCLEPILLAWTTSSLLYKRAVSIGLVAVPVVLILLAISRGLPSQSGIAYMVMLPALTGQEAMRGGFIAAGRAILAAFMDLSWLVLMCLALVSYQAFHSSPLQPGLVVVIWTVSGAVSMSIGWLIWIRHPLRSDAAPTRKDNRKDLVSLASSTVVAGAALPIASVVMNVLDQGVIAADWRTSAAIFSPFNIVASTMHLYIVPRAARTSGRELTKWIRRYQLSLIGLSLGWCAIVQVLVWSGLLAEVLGDPWRRVQPYLLLLFLSQVLLMAAGGQFVNLRLRGHPAAELRARVLYAIGMSLLVPTAVYFLDLKGAFLGAAVTAGLVALFAAWRASRILPRPLVCVTF